MYVDCGEHSVCAKVEKYVSSYNGRTGGKSGGANRDGKMNFLN